jgi:hypothetical protein
VAIFFPEYTTCEETEREARFVSTAAIVVAVAWAALAVDHLISAETGWGIASVALAMFWGVAAYRIRQLSFPWATAAVICFVVASTLAVPIISILGLILLGFLVVFINGMRATKAYRNLQPTQH